MTHQMYKIGPLSWVVLVASFLLSEQATASQKDKSSNEEVGEKIGKIEKKGEHTYKKHIEKPLNEIKKGVKHGKEEQKGKCNNMKTEKQKEKHVNN